MLKRNFRIGLFLFVLSGCATTLPKNTALQERCAGDLALKIEQIEAIRHSDKELESPKTCIPLAREALSVVSSYPEECENVLFFESDEIARKIIARWKSFWSGGDWKHSKTYTFSEFRTMLEVSDSLPISAKCIDQFH